jgi:1,2-diacylglycerol 3-beta-galactosyltransferase
MPGPRILILSSRTGGGHGRVAQTLREHLLALEPRCEITEVEGLAQTDLGVRIDPARAFLTLTTSLISIYNLCYQATNRAGVVEAVRWAIRQAYGRSLARVIRDHAPDLVVSTHHFLSPRTVAADSDSLPPFVMVVSDLGRPHRLWFDSRLHTLCVPSDDMVSYAELCIGSSPSRPAVKMLGFPVDLSGFDGRAHALNRQLLVMGGGAGTGNIEKVVHTLSAEFPEHNIIVVCGHNAALRSTIAGSGRSNVEAHGFVNNVPELMTASDLVITKAGPVTIMEAIAARRPLLITSWVGMQERDNVDFVVRQGLGIYCKNPRKLTAAVRQMYDRYADYGVAEHVDVEHGPDRIAASILAVWRKVVVGQAA